MANTINLPKTITLNNIRYPVNNWEPSCNLDGWTGRIAGMPIDDYCSSDALEMAIWEENGIKADIYADGTGTVNVRM